MSTPTNNDVTITIPDKNTTQTGQSTNCLGRMFKDWTQYPLTAVGLGLLGGAAYAIITAKFFFSAVFTVGGVASCVGCFRIRQFKPEKGLEDRVKQLDNENQEMGEKITWLGKNVKKLQKVEGKLNSVLEEARTSEKKMNSILSKKIDKLDKVKNDLSKKIEELKSLQKDFEQFKQAIEDITSEVKTRNEKNKTVLDRIKDLSGVVIDIGDHGEKIEKEVDEFDGENEEIFQHNKDLSSHLGRLKGQISLFTVNFDSFKNALPELAKHTDTLDETDDKFLAGTKNLEIVSINIGNALKEYGAVAKDSSSESD